MSIGSPVSVAAAGGDAAYDLFYDEPLETPYEAVGSHGRGADGDIAVLRPDGSLASLALLRPIAVRHLRMPARLRTGTAALVGTKALVVERVDVHGGQVKIGGDVWSARAFDETQVIEPGARVDVVKIEGATALVYE